VKRMMLGLFLLWMGLETGTTWAGQGEVLELVGNGEINWSQGIILAKGSGAPPKEAKNIAQARLMAERAALSDGRRNLMEVLKGVRVDSVTHVENHMVKSDQIRLSAEGFIQGSVELRDQRRYLSDGGIEVTVAMNLSGDFLSLMLSLPKEWKSAKPPMVEKPSSQLPPIPARKIESPPERPKIGVEEKPTLKTKPLPPSVAEKPSSQLPPIPAGKIESPPERPKIGVEEKPIIGAKPLPALADLPKFTGLVIDARGLNMRAVLIPKVVDEGGQELYQGQYVPPDKAAQNGLALYSRDLTAAQTNPRVGKNPLTVKGFKMNPNSRSDVILNADDSKRVAPFAQKGTFLEECKVMIVLD